MSSDQAKVLLALEAELDAIELQTQAIVNGACDADHAKLTALAAKTDRILGIIDTLLKEDADESPPVRKIISG